MRFRSGHPYIETVYQRSDNNNNNYNNNNNNNNSLLLFINQLWNCPVYQLPLSATIQLYSCSVTVHVYSGIQDGNNINNFEASMSNPLQWQLWSHTCCYLRSTNLHLATPFNYWLSFFPVPEVIASPKTIPTDAARPVGVRTHATSKKSEKDKHKRLEMEELSLINS